MKLSFLKRASFQLTNKKIEVMAKEEFKVGKNVTYVPNGVDFGSRPKNTPVPAVIIGVPKTKDDKGKEVLALREYEGLRNKTKVNGKRLLVNLIVAQDSDVTHVRKVHVPHKDDALDGESYFE